MTAKTVIATSTAGPGKSGGIVRIQAQAGSALLDRWAEIVDAHADGNLIVRHPVRRWTWHPGHQQHHSMSEGAIS